MLALGISLLLLVLSLSTSAMAQTKDQLVRFAKIKVDPLQNWQPIPLHYKNK